jgi:hypothetical protein
MEHVSVIVGCILPVTCHNEHKRILSYAWHLLVHMHARASCEFDFFNKTG